ncbi:MAG: hypothetical protein FD130_514 [Halothiobacillaceae bacterium]|nr:MAG: hypothetical protein FD130_514 [Halothiobacillaceae bacterium]
MKEKATKVKTRNVVGDEMRPEYDFSNAVRGKYYKRVARESNVVILDADVAAIFANSQAVNEALRNLVRIAQETERLTKGASGRGKKRSVV